MSNYYVHRNHDYDDELAHSLGGWIKRRAQGAHKYIAKIPVGGKMRYFYTQAELAAYKAGKTVSKAATNVNNRLTVGRAQARYTVKRISDTARAKVGNAVNNLTGASAKKQMNAAKAKADYSLSKVRAAKGTDNYDSAVNRARGNMKVYNEAKNRYDKSLLGRAERAGKTIGGAAGKAREGVLDAGGKAVRALRGGAGKVRGAAGKARDAAVDAIGYKKRAAAQLKTNYANGLSRSKVYDPEAHRTARVAQKEYNRTLMGRAEGAARAVGSAASSVGKKVSKTAGKASGAVRSTAKKAKQAAVDTIGYKKRAAAQLKTNYANGLSRSKVYDPEAHRTARVARKEYNKTLMGRAEAAGRAIGSAANNARRTASNAYNTATNTVNDWRKKRYLKRQSRKGQNA